MSPIVSTGAALLIITYLAFVSLGLPDAMLGVLWPDLRETFVLPQSLLGSALLAGGCGYFASSLMAGSMVLRLGVGRILVISSALMTISLLGYAWAPLWSVFLICAVLAGIGSGAIDAGLNAFAAARFSARHVNWLHACWGVGAMGGPLLATLILSLNGDWRVAYALVGIVLGLMTLMFIVTLPLWRQPGSAGGPSLLRARHVLRRPVVWLHMLLFFCYSGLEAGAGQWSFTVLTEARGVADSHAGLWVGLYWGSLTAGRIVFGAVIDRLGIDRVLRYCLLLAVLACALFWLGTTFFAQLGLIVLGFTLAPVFPSLIARTPARTGVAAAAHVIGFEVSAAIVGVALLPGLIGLLAPHFGLESIGLGLLVLALVLVALHERLLKMTAWSEDKSYEDESYD